MNGPYRLTAEQLRTLSNLACGHEVAIEPLANEGDTGPVLAFHGDLTFEIPEDGVLRPQEVPA